MLNLTVRKGMNKLIRTFGIDQKSEPVVNLDLIKLNEYNLQWFWVDFNNPNEAEVKFLSDYFKFHPLSIEDSLYSLDKPKLDYYDDYNFFILNALNKDTLEPVEISLFVGNNYVVSFHTEALREIDDAWDRVMKDNVNWEIGPTFVVHQILDKIVDQFFPAIYKIEDELDHLDLNPDKKSIHQLIDAVFEIRGNLLQLRRIINSMRDLLYRIVNSDRLQSFKEHKMYFSDIYDHLVKLSDMVESSRDMTSDMRDSYLSVNSNRMNTNMMVLTVITTIFIPLTFIAGIYGMNFQYMPELRWRFGYFSVLVLMAVIGIAMFLWFKRRGWFDS